MNQPLETATIFSIRKVVSAAFILVMLLASSIFGLAYASSWQTQIVDEYGGPGVLALDNEGKPHLAFNTPAFYTSDNRIRKTWNIMYANWNGSGWTTTEAIDRATIEDLAIDSNNNSSILYRNQRGAMTYAKLTGSNWTTQIIDNQARFGVLALDSKNQPHIAYTANGNPIDLKYAILTESGWKIQTIERPGPLDYVNDNSISIELDSNDSAHIMYSVVDKPSIESFQYPTNIKYATQKGETWNIATILKNAGLYNMALDSNGNPHLIYRPQQGSSLLNYAYKNGTVWNSSVVIEAPEKYTWRIDVPSLALDLQDTAHIAFVNTSSSVIIGNLLYGTLDGGEWIFETVDTNATSVGSLKFGNANTPQINYAGLWQDWGHAISNLNYATVYHQETKTEQTNPTNSIVVGAILATTIVAIALTAKHHKKQRSSDGLRQFDAQMTPALHSYPHPLERITSKLKLDIIFFLSIIDFGSI